MTTADIVRIVTTVAVCQLICDWLANRFFFSKETYQRALSNLERAQWKLRRTKKETEEAGKSSSAGATTSDKHQKKLQRADDDCKEAAADVAKKHTFPQVLISIFFLMLIRIFGTEYTGRPIAVLPFVPFSLLRRVTGRGLDLSLASSSQPIPQLESIAASSLNKITDINQACSFLFIYLLASLSIKYYVQKIFGTEPPPGADHGIGTIMESPEINQMVKRLGMDLDQVNDKPKQAAASTKKSKAKSKKLALNN